MSSRPKRRTVLRKSALPDATHYVGYVEDDETPEMIMRKFEEMERIKAAAVGNRRTNFSTPATSQDDAGPSTSNQALAAEVAPEQLDQEQLYEVFKATSMYNVKSLLSNNEALMASGRTQQDRCGQLPDLGGHASGGAAAFWQYEIISISISSPLLQLLPAVCYIAHQGCRPNALLS